MTEEKNIVKSGAAVEQAQDAAKEKDAELQSVALDERDARRLAKLDIQERQLQNQIQQAVAPINAARQAILGDYFEGNGEGQVSYDLSKKEAYFQASDEAEDDIETTPPK